VFRPLIKLRLSSRADICINITEGPTETSDSSCKTFLAFTHANHEGTGQQAEEISFVNKSLVRDRA